MATPKQIEANRKNSESSTGPKTHEGKSIVAGNAIKHGLLSNTVLIPGEDRALFDGLLERLWADLNPEGITEIALVERIAAYMWRLRRVFQIEAYLIEPVDNMFDCDRTFEQRMASRFMGSRESLTVLNRYEVCIERMLNHALNELRNSQGFRSSVG